MAHAPLLRKDSQILLFCFGAMGWETRAGNVDGSPRSCAASGGGLVYIACCGQRTAT